jgi:replicative DNA helicase
MVTLHQPSDRGLSDPWLSTPILAAEEAFVGALLWCDTPVAFEAASWLHSDDFSSPAAALVHRLVTELVDQGLRPDPASVLALAISSDAVAGPQQIRNLTLKLATLYDHRATVPTNVRWYACAALDQAIRRRTVEMATRLAQVAETADAEELERLTCAETAALEQLRTRLSALSDERPGEAAAA